MNIIKEKKLLELNSHDLEHIVGGDNESYDAFYKFGKWVGKKTNEFGKWVCKNAPWC